ncbi:MAG: hypothetical protein JSV20_10305 [Candidatus Bathyarchaeota archaeon]|nr:MAG: hypothetical protein JSV20_10305 [Candidatus Bathyarchaeota archaeon]
MSFKESLFSNLIRFSFRFERFFPYAVRLFLNRKLGEYKKEGQITDYTVRAMRRDRYHYSFQVDLIVDENKLMEVVENYERKS